MVSPQNDGEFDLPDGARPARRQWVSLAGALSVHVLVFLGLAASISFQFAPRLDAKIEPRIVALAPRLTPPPPDIKKLGPADVVVTTQPRFRPRAPAMVRQRREGDPALAIWTYLCNRDDSLSAAVHVSCPFQFGNVDLGVLDPLNRTGDSGVMLGADTATMSLEEAGKKKRWIKPKARWSGDGARAKGDDLGLPGHNPLEILQK